VLKDIDTDPWARGLNAEQAALPFHGATGTSAWVRARQDHKANREANRKRLRHFVAPDCVKRQSKLHDFYDRIVFLHRCSFEARIQLYASLLAPIAIDLSNRLHPKAGCTLKTAAIIWMTLRF
jgi:hypothetical protein